MQFIVNLDMDEWEFWKTKMDPSKPPLMKHRPEFRNQQHQEQQQQQQEEQQGGEREEQMEEEEAEEKEQRRPAVKRGRR